MASDRSADRPVSRFVRVAYLLASAGVAAGVSVHVAFARHFASYHPTALGVMWTTLPFVLCILAAYAVRHIRLSCLAIGAIAFFLLLSCLPYVGVTDDDRQPLFLLDFLPVLQLFGLIAFGLPVLAATWFAHVRYDRPSEQPGT